ncbi:hypothetical protein B0H12DRAFT_1224648 [Mycena haematopus]|nr:hypothetical protein B0H12DRAFT_1224648 [Mycena haematopus]
MDCAPESSPMASVKLPYASRLALRLAWESHQTAVGLEQEECRDEMDAKWLRRTMRILATQPHSARTWPAVKANRIRPPDRPLDNPQSFLYVSCFKLQGCTVRLRGPCLRTRRAVAERLLAEGEVGSIANQRSHSLGLGVGFAGGVRVWDGERVLWGSASEDGVASAPEARVNARRIKEGRIGVLIEFGERESASASASGEKDSEGVW